ncbi:class I SAM-dependent methyltransferase [Luteipulveratus flavus]|uniref:Methyltransferase domain-containing protein n=1 Tax=Luteipulveratus flavus TaxID=3031728 RepID=A0ABT6C2H5_9MICO|nr:methyltransferase domain-containing protein [Luteipulveratus sp. YIM 133296]MDF8263000.1 methyltransferase domain-containing protein [Luteipulveratus sp. YIM 133296]
MTDTITDKNLKARHRAMWASGNYPAVVDDAVGPLGPILVREMQIRAGERVLDVAAGSGNASVPAALAGAEVVASDLTPELFDAGRRAAAEQGATLSWEEADAEALPYEDASFDVTLSCLGVMFAPHHQAAADELLRVTRPGGRIGLLSWTPEGFIGRMFATMKPYAPPPPLGAQPPPLWGSPDHVRELLGERVEDLSARRERLSVDHFTSGADFRDYFKRVYGPTIAVYRSLGDDAERVAELDQALAALGQERDLGGGRMEWEYLLVTARRR